MSKNIEAKMWAFKYRPCDPEAASFNKSIFTKMKTFLNKLNFPHIIFYGPPGSGKRTLVNACLQYIYGKTAAQVSKSVVDIHDHGQKIKCSLIEGQYHVQININDPGEDNIFAIKKSMKYVCQKVHHEIGIVAINDFDVVSKQTQSSLRRAMEKYYDKCRIFITCESISKIIPPLLSRCLLVRVPAPTETEIYNGLGNILKNEMNEVAHDIIIKVVKSSSRNMRKAINTLQQIIIEHSNMEFMVNQRDALIKQLINTISTEIKDFNYTCIEKVEKILEALSEECDESEVIIKLVNDLSMLYPHKMPELIFSAVEYESRINVIQDSMINIEAFVAKAIKVIYSLADYKIS